MNHSQTIRAFITALGIAVTFSMHTGCSVGMALHQPSKKNLGVLKEGMPRSLLLAEFGQPVVTESREGRKVDVFSFTQGYSKSAKAGRAMLHGTADFITCGLWEIVGTPTETIFDGKKKAFEVTYGPGDRVAKVVSLQN